MLSKSIEGEKQENDKRMLESTNFSIRSYSCLNKDKRQNK